MKITFFRLLKLLAYVVVFSTIAGCASNKLAKDEAATRQDFSGFLPDYTRLKKVTDASGNELLRWISPKLNKKNYQKVILSDPVYVPAPKATAQVTNQVLDQIRAYGRKTLMDKLARQGLLADKPGPGVLRVNLALTGVTAKTSGLKPWEVIPVALITAGIETATGERSQNVHMFVEAEIVDSVTSELRAESVRDATGVPLKNEKTRLTLDNLKPKIDQWTDTVVAEAVRMLK